MHGDGNTHRSNRAAPAGSNAIPAPSHELGRTHGWYESRSPPLVAAPLELSLL